VTTTLSRDWSGIRRDWRHLTLHQRFEASMAFVLMFVIWAIVIVALYRLCVSVVETLVLRTLNPLEHDVFQQIFGQIMTLLIALEFNHTLQYAAAGERGVIQARIVLVIAQLALARKVIVADLYDAAPLSIAATGLLALALAVAYFLMRESTEPVETQNIAQT
jgi:uncharacterized membrane protein (DUF373 family)